MSQFLDSIRDVKKNYKIYDVWEQNQADDVAKRRYLAAKLELPKDKVELTKAKAQAVFRASDMMDKRSEDNCANMEQTTGLISTAFLLPITVAIALYSQKKMNSKQLTYFSLIAAAASILPSIGFALWGTAKQKEASRIGRFQAKQNELKDAKNFVIYTPEQIEAAKNSAQNVPDKKTKKSISQLFADMNQMSKDKAEYQKWHNQNIDKEKEIQKILGKNFTPEQMAQGEEDKEIIVNIVKDVNMNAETYSENVENIFDAIGLMSGLTAIPLGVGINKILNRFKNVSPVVRKISSIGTASLFALGMMFWATREKKQGSRVGRFVKRQEILDNPELIMSYSNEQLKLAKDIKAPKVTKNFFGKIKDNLTFFKKYLKELKEYKNYKETTAKENEKIYEELKQTNVSKIQLKEAKNLQEKTFRAFDKMDEMSQRYSEDTEAATQIAMQVIGPISAIVIGSLPLPIVFAIKNGKIPLARIIKTSSNIALKKDSSIRNFIDKSYDLIAKDKEMHKDFSKILIDKKIKEKFLNHPKLQNLYSELYKNNEEQFSNLLKAAQAKDNNKIKNIVTEIFNVNAKQDPISKWFRNFSSDILVLRAHIKAKKESTNAIKKTGQSINPFNLMKKFYNDYRTLSKTIVFGGFVPIIAIAAGIPIVLASWMTNIQLKASRIGIMKAMEEVDNPKLFVMNDSEDA